MIELLVVIAIIALLAAILFPVFGRARENARRSSCASNLKQLSLGWFQYEQDSDGKLPEFAGCNNCKVAPYVKSIQVFICPSSHLALTPKYAASASETNNIMGTEYGMPAAYSPYKAAIINIAGTGVKPVTIMDSIPEPAKTCLLGEVERYTGSLAGQVGFDKFNARDLSAAGVTNYQGILVPDRHFEGGNYAFMDGHVKWLKEDVVMVPHDQNQRIVFYWD